MEAVLLEAWRLKNSACRPVKERLPGKGDRLLQLPREYPKQCGRDPRLHPKIDASPDTRGPVNLARTAYRARAKQINPFGDSLGRRSPLEHAFASFRVREKKAPARQGESKIRLGARPPRRGGKNYQGLFNSVRSQILLISL